MPAVRRPPYVAYLRVFEPVEHLPAGERERWTASARSPQQREGLEAAQFADSVRRLAGRPPAPLPAEESSDGLLLDLDGTVFVCPQQPRLRVLRQLAADPAGLPLVLRQLVPPELRARAASELAAASRSGTELRLFTLSTCWRVPVAWFVPFAPGDRSLDLAPPGRSLRYRTAMSSARRRCAHGLRTARTHLDDTDVIDEIEQVSRWLELFDHRSVLELDYAALVDLLDDHHLRGDDSAADVADGLAALSEGDELSAAAAYRRWTSRWQRLALLARAS